MDKPIDRTQPAQAQRTTPVEAAPGGHPMEILISYVLRGGVLIAGAIIAAGLVLLLIQGPAPGDPRSLADLHARGGATVHISLATIWHGVAGGRAANIIELGLLALILTPIARVAMTVLLFLAQHDRIFVAVTCIVLVILLLGLAGVGS